MLITDITKIGDPQIVPFQGKYYMYATSDPEGFLVYESSDLINWSEGKLCFRAIESWGKSHFWAAEVRFVPRLFYFYL